MRRYYCLTFEDTAELIDFKGEVRKQMYIHSLDCDDIQRLTGYSVDSLRKWFSQRDNQSSRFLSAEMANLFDINVKKYSSCDQKYLF